MKMRAALIGALSIVLVFSQDTIAQPQAEVNYLAEINRIVKTLKGLSRVHASTPVSLRLKYGYEICRTLDKGATMSDLRTLIFNNELTANETSYFSAMQVLAICELCPEYKPLLKNDASLP